MPFLLAFNMAFAVSISYLAISPNGYIFQIDPYLYITSFSAPSVLDYNSCIHSSNLHLPILLHM